MAAAAPVSIFRRVAQKVWRGTSRGLLTQVTPGLMARDITVLFVRGFNVYDVGFSVGSERPLSIVKALALDALTKLFAPGTLLGADLDFSLISQADATAIAEKRSLSVPGSAFVATRTVSSAFAECESVGYVLVTERGGECLFVRVSPDAVAGAARRLVATPAVSACDGSVPTTTNSHTLALTLAIA